MRCKLNEVKMTVTRSLLLVLMTQLAAASDDKRLEERVDALKDFTRSVENQVFQVQDNLTHVLQSIDRRLSRLEEISEQLQQRVVPKGVSFGCPTVAEYVEVSGKCLFFSNSELSHQQAMERCSETGGRLAIIDNCQLMHDIAKYLDNAGIADSGLVDGYWVGASDSFSNEGSFLWDNASPVPKGPTFWGRQIYAAKPSNEPNGGFTENCLLMRTAYNFRFGDSVCDNYNNSGKSPFCQYDDDVCSSPRVLIEGRCVEFLSDVEVDWTGAGAECADRGGRLATVDGCNLLGAVIAYILRAGVTPTEGYWIGGSDLAEEGTWLWKDGTPVPMGAPFWGQATEDGESEGTLLEPNNYRGGEHCVKMQAKLRWLLNDDSCSRSTSVHALCEARHIIAA